jgi:Ca-activated chloride channel homolog
MPGTSTMHQLGARALQEYLWLTLLCASTVAPTKAQDIGVTAIAAVSESSWSFHKQVNEVNVLFVAKRHGKFVNGLTENDIRVIDDGKPAEAILGFRSEHDLAMRVGLIIDTSDSITRKFRFEQAAASAFLRHVLNGPADLAFVLGFSSYPRLTQDFAHDPDLLSQGIQQLAIGGGTALYDAIGFGCEKLRSHSEADKVARILVVLSDGENNAGTLDLNGAIDTAENAEVSIYAISTHYEKPDLEHVQVKTQGDMALRKLAEETGGLLLRPDGPRDVPRAFAQVAKEVRARYAVSYRPVDFTSDGHYRSIKIEARKDGKKLRVRARKGYFARVTVDSRSGDTEQSRSFPESLQDPR